MTNLSISLICGTCSHDWTQDLAEIDTFKVTKRADNQYAKVYRISCPICGHILMVETDAGPDDIPTAWGT
jgi:hypothetical protein